MRERGVTLRCTLGSSSLFFLLVPLVIAFHFLSHLYVLHFSLNKTDNYKYDLKILFSFTKHR